VQKIFYFLKLPPSKYFGFSSGFGALSLNAIGEKRGEKVGRGKHDGGPESSFARWFFFEKKNYTKKIFIFHWIFADIFGIFRVEHKSESEKQLNDPEKGESQLIASKRFASLIKVLISRKRVEMKLFSALLPPEMREKHAQREEKSF
jgi:hypothetical protein